MREMTEDYKDSFLHERIRGRSLSRSLFGLSGSDVAGGTGDFRGLV